MNEAIKQALEALPPLPEPTTFWPYEPPDGTTFTADQMRDYARAAIASLQSLLADQENAAIQKALTVCDACVKPDECSAGSCFRGFAVLADGQAVQGVAPSEPMGYVMPADNDHYAKFVDAEHYARLSPAARRCYTIPVVAAPTVQGVADAALLRRALTALEELAGDINGFGPVDYPDEVATIEELRKHVAGVNPSADPKVVAALDTLGKLGALEPDPSYGVKEGS